MLRLAVVFLAGLALACLPARADTKLIYAGTLFAVPGQEPLKQQTIVVKDGRIAAFQTGFVRASTGERVIDLRNQFVLPGLIDCHVHILGETGGFMSEAQKQKAVQVGPLIQAALQRAGKAADIVAVDKDPTREVRTMERMRFVMRGGVVYVNP